MGVTLFFYFIFLFFYFLSVTLWLKAVSVQGTCNGQVSGTLLRGRGVS